MTVRTAWTSRPGRAWPRGAGWLVPGLDVGTPGASVTWLEYLIVARAQRDEGILEQPWGSNRGTRLDAYVKRFRNTVGEWWCAHWVGCVWIDCGAQVPEDYPSCDAWRPHLMDTPRPGSAILYGVPGDLKHIGIVARTGTGMPKQPPSRQLLVTEGNRGYAGDPTNNGVAVATAPLTRRDVQGYVRPRPVPGWRIDDFAPLDFLVAHLAALPADVAARTRARLRAL